MKHKIEDLFYFLTLWFCGSIIVLGIIGLIFKAIAHICK
jgi:hypothetical protein